MQQVKAISLLTTKLLIGLTTSGFVATIAFAQPNIMQMNDEHTATSATKVAIAGVTTSHDWAARHGMYYKRNWGIDIIGVRPVSSGQMLTFRYRVLDADKAKPLFDKTAKPFVIDEASGTRLAVPAMENVGELRQSTMLETNRNYFIVFGNPGKIVKSGSKVSLVIGNFRIDDLIVD